MQGYRFATDLSVRFSETDAQGIANNSVYLNWFEVARIAYLARFPGGYRGLIEQGVEALTIEAHVRYLAPCGFDDQLRIHTRVIDLRGARFRFEWLDWPRLRGRDDATPHADARLAGRRHRRARELNYPRPVVVPVDVPVEVPRVVVAGSE
jgi:YbgC/YbaW family acyl-CoA thioester hydrolase